MDNSSQPTAKQQAIETLRSAESVVITTAQNPDRDQIAAAIGLHLLLVKLDKVAEVVITSDIPKQLSFLSSDFINKEIHGQRDFVIELDQSQTEADHLKYVTEDGKLKIYITPYNGVFSQEDVNFSYGEYHCDAVIGLGVNNTGQLDPAITAEKELTDKARFVFISAQGGGSEQGTNWSDHSASSVCEMVMSMSEALGSGMMDRDIATALFTGIVDKTEHFTNASTTPKVMTMAAQLMAAGANQTEIVKQLAIEDKPAPKTPEAPKPEKKPEEKTPEQAPPASNVPPAAHQQPAPSAPKETTSHEDHAQKTDTQPTESQDKPDKPNEYQVRQPQTDKGESQATSPDFNVRKPDSSEVSVGPDGKVVQKTETETDTPPPTQQPAAKPPAPDTASHTPPPPPVGTVGASVNTPPSKPAAPQQQPPTPPQTSPPSESSKPPQPNAAPQASLEQAAQPAPTSADRAREERVLQPPSQAPQQTPPTVNQSQEKGQGGQNQSPSADLDAARRAVEEAHQQGSSDTQEPQNNAGGANPASGQPPKQ